MWLEFGAIFFVLWISWIICNPIPFLISHFPCTTLYNIVILLNVVLTDDF